MNEFEQAVKELLDEDCQLHYEDFAEQCRYLMSMARKVISKEQNN